MEPTPVAPAPAPAKKSSVGMVIAIVVVAVLSLCCCIPGIINIISPMPFSSSTSGIIGNSSSNGTLPGYAGIVCICAAIIPWIVLGIVLLIRRPKKQQ